MFPPGGGFPGDPVPEGLCGSGSGLSSWSCELDRQRDTEHGNGPTGLAAVGAAGTFDTAQVFHCSSAPADLSFPLQLTADDYLPMLKLLPVLEKLSQVHSVAAVQETAFSLRSVIATRGAFQPEDLRQHSREFSSTGEQRTQAQVDHSGMPPQSSASHSLPPPSTQKIHSASSGGAAGVAAKCSSSTDPPQSHFQGFSDVLLEALDPDVPTRAVALRELIQMVQNKRPEALQAQEEILNVS